MHDPDFDGVGGIGLEGETHSHNRGDVYKRQAKENRRRRMVEIFENNVRSGEGRVTAEIDLSECGKPAQLIALVGLSLIHIFDSGGWSPRSAGPHAAPRRSVKLPPSAIR